jgi:hypothetical protein
MNIVSDYPKQTRSLRSCGFIRSRSASELLLDAKDQASSPHDGLLRTTRHNALITFPDKPFHCLLPPIPVSYYRTK